MPKSHRPTENICKSVPDTGLYLHYRKNPYNSEFLSCSKIHNSTMGERFEDTSQKAMYKWQWTHATCPQEDTVTTSTHLKFKRPRTPSADDEMPQPDARKSLEVRENETAALENIC